MTSRTYKTFFALAVLALVLAPVAKNFAQGSPQVPSPQAPAPAGAQPAAAAASTPGPAGSFSRHADPIVLKGEQVPEFAGARETDFRVFASRGGKLEAIPCQMDERNQWGEFVVTKAAGGDGINHMDKLKVRVMQNLRRGFTLGIPTRLDRTEKNFLVKVYGYKDGPVRALRVMKVNLQLIWKLPAPGATVNSVF